MNTLKLLKSTPHFLACSFWRNICLSIILALVFTSSTQPELKTLPGDYGSNSHLNNRDDADHYVKRLKDPTSDPSEWLICETNSWEDLKNYLPEAKMAGISLSVILLPPYQPTQVCSEGSYSEPYGQDYIRWAQEIASLSLRYSNLNEYGIYDLQENINLGFLRQTYIDSVIAAANSINPRLQFINTSTPTYKVWYVDRDATGTGDGTSWTNAATSVSTLDWGLIQAGDTVYISGGEVSKTYPKDYISNKIVIGNPVVVTKGWESGHNGEVIFELTYALGNPAPFRLNNCENIKLTGLTFTSTEEDSSISGMIRADNGQNNIIDNSHIISNGNGYGVYTQFETKLTISNSTIEILTNGMEWGSDPIYMSSGGGGHTITGNTLINRGVYVAAAHKDCIQMYKEGSANNYQMTIANNLMLMQNTTSPVNQGVQFELMYGNRLLWYNNIMVLNAGQQRVFAYTTIAGYDNSIRIFNNTIIANGLLDIGYYIAGVDSLIMKNNLSVFDSSTTAGGHLVLGVDSLNEIGYIDIDYNGYFEGGGLKYGEVEKSQNADEHTWAQWQALGYDVNSDTTYNNIAFAGKYDSTIIAYKLITGSFGIDDGIDLSGTYPELSTDILGVARGILWNMGAVELIK